MDGWDRGVGVHGAVADYLVYAVEDGGEGVFDWHVLCGVSGSLLDGRLGARLCVSLPSVIFAKGREIHFIHVVAHGLHQAIVWKIAMLFKFFTRHCDYLIEWWEPVRS